MRGKSVVCPENREHKFKAVYNSPLSKGWIKIDNYFYCSDCQTMYGLYFKKFMKPLK